MTITPGSRCDANFATTRRQETRLARGKKRKEGEEGGEGREKRGKEEEREEEGEKEEEEEKGKREGRRGKKREERRRGSNDSCQGAAAAGAEAATTSPTVCCQHAEPPQLAIARDSSRTQPSPCERCDADHHQQPLYVQAPCAAWRPRECSCTVLCRRLALPVARRLGGRGDHTAPPTHRSATGVSADARSWCSNWVRSRVARRGRPAASGQGAHGDEPTRQPGRCVAVAWLTP